MAIAHKNNRLLLNINRYMSQFNFLGLLVALLFFCLSLTPSLLPRPWLYQGLITGVSLAIGYAIGSLISWLIRWLFQKEPTQRVKAASWRMLSIIGPLALVVFLYVGASWQNEVRQLVGEATVDGRHMLRILFLSLLVGLLLLSIARGIRKLTRRISTFMAKRLPPRLSTALSVGVVLLLVFWLINGVMLSSLVDVANNIYSEQNNTTPEGVTQPTSSYRSGSPDSYVPWDSLGRQGQSFVSRGPSQQQLQTVTGTTPKEQIRVYVGLNSSQDAQSRAQLALQELERTNAFSRKVLVVATATGTGWLEPQSTDSIEYMYGGDTAIVTQQYSYLPSWISFLVDKQNATTAGRALFDEVYGKWVTLPKDQRPKLIVYGLSLGSFGGQAAFSGVNGLKHSTDGALFMGTPSDTTLWRQVTDDRDAGSPEWQPTYQDGQTVRFAATNDDIRFNPDGWKFPRILYMQHASDPVVWFNFNLLLHEPDWLREPRGPDVSANMHWYPFVTFFQVAVDQFFGVSVPNGHGHNYPNTIVEAWAAVVPPAGWTQAQEDKLQSIIDTYSNE